MITANKPRIEMGWLRAVLYIVITICLLSVTLIVAGIISSANAGKEVMENGGATITGFLLNYAVVSVFFIGMAFLCRKFIDRQSIASLGFRWKGYRSQATAGFFIAVLILCAGSMVLVLLKYLFFTGVELNTENLLYSLILFIIVAFTEEIAFRGYILSNLMQSMNKWAALSVSSVAFALVHFTNPGGDNILPMLNIFVAGFLLGINYIYTKNLWFAIFLHFSWNFFQGPVLGYEVSGFAAKGLLLQSVKGPDLLTGGDFGFEGSLVCLVINTGVCVLLARHYETLSKKTTPHAPGASQ